MLNKFTRQQKETMIAEIQRFFFEERDEKIGILAAENVFEFFKEELGPYFYNDALKDARKLVEQKMTSIEEDLYSLEKKQSDLGDRERMRPIIRHSHWSFLPLHLS